jgi:hypothetical protein
MKCDVFHASLTGHRPLRHAEEKKEVGKGHAIGQEEPARPRRNWFSPRNRLLGVADPNV